jgi:hypothetical protein
MNNKHTVGFSVIEAVIIVVIVGVVVVLGLTFYNALTQQTESNIVVTTDDTVPVIESINDLDTVSNDLDKLDIDDTDDAVVLEEQASF